MDKTPTPPPLTPSNPDIPAFDPVETRARHDGWTPDRQLAFVEALAESACVTDAAKSVGMSAAAAYSLRNRNEAGAFRVAWDVALAIGVRALGDAVISRALHGEAVPIFHKGEQVGERRRFDNRLAQFVLRTQDPLRFGAWIDRHDFTPAANPHAVFARATNALNDALHGAETDREASVETYLLLQADPDNDPDDVDGNADADADNEPAYWATEEGRAASRARFDAAYAAQNAPAEPPADPESVADTPDASETESCVVPDPQTEPFIDPAPSHFAYYPPAKPRLISDLEPGTAYLDWEDGVQKIKYAW